MKKTVFGGREICEFENFDQAMTHFSEKRCTILILHKEIDDHGVVRGSAVMFSNMALISVLTMGDGTGFTITDYTSDVSMFNGDNNVCIH